MKLFLSVNYSNNHTLQHIAWNFTRWLANQFPNMQLLFFSDQATVCTNHLLVVMLYLGENLSRCTCMICWHCQKQNASWSLLYQIIIKKKSFNTFIYKYISEKLTRIVEQNAVNLNLRGMKFTEIKTLQNINKSWGKTPKYFKTFSMNFSFSIL